MAFRTAFADLPITRKLMAITLATSVAAVSIAAIAFASSEAFSYRKSTVADVATLADVIGISMLNGGHLTGDDGPFDHVAASKAGFEHLSEIVHGRGHGVCFRHVWGNSRYSGYSGQPVVSGGLHLVQIAGTAACGTVSS